MKSVIVGAHLRSEDIDPVATALPCGELWLSAVEVPDDQALGDRDLVLRVAKTRAALLDRATFVAIRYGFAAHSAAEAAAKCAPHIGRWKAVLELRRGEIEMTLKIAAANPKQRPSRSDFDSGAAYLKALHDASTAAHIDPDFRAAVDATIGSLSSALRWIHRDNSSLEAAALLRRDRVDDVRAAGETLKRDFPRVPFLLSGPWPLEVFADADHE